MPRPRSQSRPFSHIFREDDDANDSAAQQTSAEQQGRRLPFIVNSDDDGNNNNDDNKPQQQRGNSIWSFIGSALTLGFSIAGLVLTFQGQVRGDSYLFMVAFSVSIAVSSFQLLLTCCACVCICIMARRNVVNKFCVMCPSLSTLIVGLLGYITCFGVLVAALASSHEVEPLHEMGCDHYGCANIMAVIAAAIYGITVCAFIFIAACAVCGASIATCIYYRFSGRNNLNMRQ